MICGSCGPDGEGFDAGAWWEDAYGFWSDTFFDEYEEAFQPDEGEAGTTVMVTHRRPNLIAWLALFWLLFTLWYLLFRES